MRTAAEAAEAKIISLEKSIEVLRSDCNALQDRLATTNEQLTTTQRSLDATSARRDELEKDLQQTEMSLANERREKADIEVSFKARRTDLEAKFALDTGRIGDLENALKNLSDSIGSRDEQISELTQSLTTHQATVEELRTENAALQEQATEREESFKKLRMAIAVANTFAGQVGREDESETGESES